MTYTLVIVESPAKCGKIEGFLGPGYKCMASYGHIQQLSNLKNIDMENINRRTLQVVVKDNQGYFAAGTNVTLNFPATNPFSAVNIIKGHTPEDIQISAGLLSNSIYSNNRKNSSHTLWCTGVSSQATNARVHPGSTPLVASASRHFPSCSFGILFFSYPKPCFDI